MDRFAGNEVSGDNTERNFHLAEIAGSGESVEKFVERRIGGHSHARQSPAAEIAETSAAALLGHHVEWSSARVGRRDQRANAGARDKINGDFVLFKNAQNADMGDEAREPPKWAMRPATPPPRAPPTVGRCPSPLYANVRKPRNAVPSHLVTGLI